MDFDADRIYYSHQNLQQQAPQDQSGGGANNDAADDRNGRLEEGEDHAADPDAMRRHFREFLSEWCV